MKASEITDAQFDAKLGELANEHGVDWLLTLPGVYEIVSEELNNDIIDAVLADADTEID